ncbi:MAG: type II toxin-antitoxin system Phd/YefM family antitoxin [Terriglobales bacterium]|jgi:antitoxin (DNA-binding transcriptional repressor) of toxin-antitoxin stability system
MRAVGIKILKNKLSEYVRAAAAGETILVLDRERVVAELHPPAANRPRLGVDARLAEQIRLGNITPPLKPGAGPLPRRHPMVSFEQLMRDIEADREDRDLPR